MSEGIIMTDGPHVKPMVKWLNFEPLHKAGGEPVIIQVPDDFQKIASQIHPEIQTFLADNPTPKNTTRIIVTALGAFDGYGSNVNGDGFYEKDLLKIPKDIYLGKNRYQKPMYNTFIDFARLYKMHRNKMHNHAYGEIPFNIYNKGMKRVENILDIYEDDPENADIQKTKKELEEMKNEHEGLNPGTLVMTEKGQMKVEDIKVGEMVQTRTGELKMVTRVTEIPVPDKMIGIRVTGEHETLILTDSHDIYSIKRNSLTHKNGRLRENKNDLAVPDWIFPKYLETLDYLVEPIFIREYVPDYDIDERVAYLLGLYVGDGSFSEKKVFGKKQSSLTIESDVNKPGIYRKMTDHCLDLKWNFSFTFTQKNTFKFTIRNDSFGKLALRLFGTGSQDKFIHPSVFSWSKEQKLAFLGGYIDSDGHFNEAKGSTRISSVNENLMQQTKHMAWSIEIGCTIQRDPIGNTAGGFRKDPGFGYVLNFNRSASKYLQRYSEKINDKWNFNVVPSGANFFFTHEGKRYIAKKVQSIEYVKSPSKIVYNLKIADDQSFLAGGNIVHNR